MPGHRDIGEMPVHCAGGHDEGSIHRRALRLVDRRGIAVIDRGVIGDGDRDHAGSAIAVSAVELGRDPAFLDPGHRSEHAVLHSEIPVVLKEHNSVTGGKGSLAVMGLEEMLATEVPLIGFTSRKLAPLLPCRTDIGIERPHIDPPMRHGHARAVGTRRKIRHIIPDNLSPRAIAGLAEADSAMPGIGGKSLRSSMPGKTL